MAIIKKLKLFLFCLIVFKAFANENVLFMSDIHFNPFGLCDKAQCLVLANLIESDIKYWPKILASDNVINYKEETSNGMLLTGLFNLRPIIKKDRISNVFLTGDILAHGFDDKYFKYAPEKYKNQKGLTYFTLKVSEYVLSQVELATDNASIFYVLGNNDGDHGDYLVPSNEFLSSTANILNKNLPIKTKDVFNSEFSKGGFYSLPLNDKTQIIGLNINLLSHINANENLAEIQLKWLKSALSSAHKNHKKIIMIQHIPYGMDTYKTANIKLNIMLLNPKLQQKYLQLIDQYSSDISIIFAGHFHADYMILLPKSNIPIVSTIAFNSFFGNNPGFKILNVSDNGSLIDYSAYYSDISKSKKLDWQEEYRLSTAYNDNNIIQIIKNIPRSVNNPITKNYRKFYNGNSIGFLQPISSDNDWDYYYCAIQNINSNLYQECLDRN